ncbi:MAG: SIMPL domain-containing protein [Bacteroidales bacterium]|nr:SIMPL domain-containing protein [Bacteroidales bacterium]
MKHLTAFLLCLCALSLSAQEKNYLDRPYIEVQGEAKMLVVPDEIYIRILLQETDKQKVKVEVLERNMVRELKALGIDIEKQLSVSDMASNFRHYWIKSSAIRTSKEYQLKVGTANLAGKVFQRLEAVGISNLSIVKTDHSQIESLKMEVKKKAIVNAKTKAQEMAAAIGQSVGAALNIVEYNNSPVRYNLAMKSRAMVTMDEAVLEEDAPELEFEKIELNYSVMARFDLLEKGKE